jgi:hypothetical protein
MTTSPLELIRAALRADIPVLLWGAPGTGKTAGLRALAVDEGAHLETLIGSTLDPIDVSGFLRATPGGVVQDPPPWARRLREALDRKQPAWLFLDELSCAPSAVQAALLRVVQERQVGDVSLAGCRVIAAANPADFAADGGILSAASANRFLHIEWNVDLNAWAAGELAGWGQRRTAAEAHASARIVAFIRRHPSALLAPPDSTEARGRAWPSPRTWSAAARLLAYAPTAMAEVAVAAAVGHAAAVEWAEWDRAASLPDPEDLLNGRAALPDRGDQLTAALGAVVAAALSDHVQRDARIERAWQLLSAVRPDQALVAARALIDATGVVPEIARALGCRIIAARNQVAAKVAEAEEAKES